MIFCEWNSVYYNAVAEILAYAVRGELTESRMREIVSQKAFGESGMTIPSALTSERWQLLKRDMTTPLKQTPKLPLSTVEKRWLKAISLDARIKLFGINFSGLEDVEPLFTPNDIYYFDRYSDGDDFENEGYIERFSVILQAIKQKKSLCVEVFDRAGKRKRITVFPEYLEYSEKDDKFRLITTGSRGRRTLNLAHVLSCELTAEKVWQKSTGAPKACEVTFELLDGRNTLERAMLHFAHFEKSVEKTDEDRYLVCLKYEAGDETELLIRILSFGPFIKVIAPNSFVNLIKNRLKKQKRCEI